jgi:hypothetical protein
MTTDELRQRVSMLANQIRASKSELNRLEDEIKCVPLRRLGRAAGGCGRAEAGQRGQRSFRSLSSVDGHDTRARIDADPRLPCLPTPPSLGALSPAHRLPARRTQTARIKDNEEKVKLNKALPWLVGNVVELLDAPEEDQEEQARGVGYRRRWPQLGWRGMLGARARRPRSLRATPPPTAAPCLTHSLSASSCARSPTFTTTRTRRRAPRWTRTTPGAARRASSRRPRGRRCTCPSRAWWTWIRSSRETSSARCVRRAAGGRGRGRAARGRRVGGREKRVPSYGWRCHLAVCGFSRY